VAVCVLYALAGALLAGCWQAATVHFNYRGNWTALFCTGSQFPVPPELAAGTYTFQGSNGYDGQFYRYVAHDPWFQKGWSRYCDQPVLRRVRITLPALAWILAAGQDRAIDAAYIGVVLLSIGAGIYWLARYVAAQGGKAAWGLMFLLIPGTLISIDRLTIDIALIALTAAWVWYIRSDCAVGLYIVLVLAGLTRETGLLLTGACCVHALRDRRWRKAALYATAALPAAAWYSVVVAHVGLANFRGAGPHPWWFYFRLLAGIVQRMFQLNHYPFGPEPCDPGPGHSRPLWDAAGHGPGRLGRPAKRTAGATAVGSGRLPGAVAVSEHGRILEGRLQLCAAFFAPASVARPGRRDGLAMAAGAGHPDRPPHCGAICPAVLGNPARPSLTAKTGF
jgi:hypothetical protein